MPESHDPSCHAITTCSRGLLNQKRQQENYGSIPEEMKNPLAIRGPVKRTHEKNPYQAAA